MTTADGEIRGLSYQATPGMLVYRRSIAQAVLGTDDPEVVGAAVADWDKFYETAGQMKEAGYYMYSGRADTARVYSNNVSAPWVKNDKTVVVDPNMMNWVERSMEDIASGVSHNVPGQWNDEWNKDMGPDSKVFCFFLPAWGLDVCIAPNVKDTAAAQDWAVCPSPQSFFWGGTWLMASNNSANKEAVGEIIRWITLDCSETGLQYMWANGTLNGEGGTKDCVASGTVMEMSDGSLDFLGGQNMFDAFVPANQYANGKCLTQYDETINTKWRDQVRQYTSGTKTRDQAIKDFKQDVADNLDVTVDLG